MLVLLERPSWRSSIGPAAFCGVARYQPHTHSHPALVPWDGNLANSDGSYSIQALHRPLYTHHQRIHAVLQQCAGLAIWSGAKSFTSSMIALPSLKYQVREEKEKSLKKLIGPTLYIWLFCGDIHYWADQRYSSKAGFLLTKIGVFFWRGVGSERGDRVTGWGAPHQHV